MSNVPKGYTSFSLPTSLGNELEFFTRRAPADWTFSNFIANRNDLLSSEEELASACNEYMNLTKKLIKKATLPSALAQYLVSLEDDTRKRIRKRTRTQEASSSSAGPTTTNFTINGDNHGTVVVGNNNTLTITAPAAKRQRTDDST